MFFLLFFQNMLFAGDSSDHANSAAELSGQLPSMGFPPITVSIFVGAFIFSLIIDLLQHRNSHEITFKGSVIWSIFWILLSLGFWGWLNFGPPELVLGEMIKEHDPDEILDWQNHYASMFLTGYVLEKTLSVDNLMVFIAIFKFFNIKDVLQHRILYFGILGAIIFRGIFVGLGTFLLMFAGYAELIFGALVFYAGWQMWRASEEEEEEEDPDYENMWLVKFFNRFYPIFPKLVGKKFFVSGKKAAEEADKDDDIEVDTSVARYMTPAFVCLLVIEGSDVLFAVDSVPAVIAVTREPLLVFSSMIFAILGLRALYFVLVVLTKYLVHIETAVIFVLFFIAAKMFLHAYEVFAEKFGWGDLPAFLHITPNMSMIAVLVMLSLGVIASLIWPGKDEEEEEAA